MPKTTTSARLKQLMRERNLRQTDILELAAPYCKAYNIKLSKAALSQYVNGKYVPDQDKILVLSSALKVNPAWLMGHDVGLNSSPQDPLEEEKQRLLSEIAALSPEDIKKVLEYARFITKDK